MSDSTTVVNCMKQHYDVYIGRGSGYPGELGATGTPGEKTSKWHNPFRVDMPNKKQDGNRHEVIEKYRQWIVTQPDLIASLHELKAKRLGCFCHPKACHGDVLAEMADRSGAGSINPGL